jgi:MoaA/NifB/PqqE/SkfB family radical SAM enzyme
MRLTIQYRGSLSSCNYHCDYCPFAKRWESKVQLARDRRELARFTAWLADQSEYTLSVMFTPWGEALVRPWYRRAAAALTHLPHVADVAAQTNLSGPLAWIDDCRCDRLALWATYHPTEVEQATFLRRVARVREAGVRISVGVVGVPAAIDRIVALREELPRDVYLWINPQQPRPRPYSGDERAIFTAIDPHFARWESRYPSRGKHCIAGELAFTVDGRGDMRRCHFVEQVIGNIYESDWRQSLTHRACPNRFCHCFLGKAHAQADDLQSVFGTNVLARIPRMLAV